MSEVRMKKWNMRPETRQIVSKAYNLCKEINETYNQKVGVRQIYYRLFSEGLIELTERDYHRVCRILTEARKRGFIPFRWITDRSRNPIWRMLYQDIKQFLDSMIKKYRRNTWNNQQNFVIILLEKEALAEIVWDIAKDYNVFVFPTKGFSSWSMFVEDIKDLVDHFGKDKRLVVLVLSDLDRSGQLIKEDYINKFKFMSEELGFTVPSIITKIALIDAQIKTYNLPLIKKEYRETILDIAELDALDPKILRIIIKEAIEKYLDLEKFYTDLEVEKKEAETLQSVVEYAIETSLSIGGDG